MSNGKNKTPAKTQYWCWTLNNPTIAEEEAIKAYARGDGASYLIFGRERGESGVYHFQGYTEFQNRQRLTTIKKIAGFNRCHFEPRRGTSTEAAQYCKKELDFFEHGTLKVSQQGRRTDLEAIKAKLDAGATEREIADAHFGQWVIFRRSFQEYRELGNAPRYRPDLKVVLLRGNPGTGKSSYVYSRWPDCWISTNPILRWFDGYGGQRVSLIDDFNGETPFRFLLRLLDKYPIRVEVKGGHTPWNPEIIFITSNRDVMEWYGGERDTAAIARRITRNISLEDLEKPNVRSRHLAIDEILRNDGIEIPEIREFE